jgi:hypothetical protein
VSGATARFNTVDLSCVFLPPFTKSMSSLSTRDSLTRPTPNEAWSIQSRGLPIPVGNHLFGFSFQCLHACHPSLGTIFPTECVRQAHGPNVGQSVHKPTEFHRNRDGTEHNCTLEREGRAIESREGEVYASLLASEPYPSLEQESRRRFPMRLRGVALRVCRRTPAVRDRIRTRS